MKTLSLIAGAAIRLSLLTGAALAGQDDAKSVHLAGAAHGATMKPGEMVGLNPQPEPPSRKKVRVAPRDLVGLNPQPEPPLVGLRLLMFIAR